MVEQQDKLVLEVQLRTVIGKSECKKLRKKGLIPAVFCDKGQSTPILVNPQQVLKVYKTQDKSCILKIGDINKEVLIKEIQHDPLKRNLLHVDFVAKN